MSESLGRDLTREKHELADKLGCSLNSKMLRGCGGRGAGRPSSASC